MKATALSKKRNERAGELKKAKKFDRAKVAQRKAGRADAAVSQLTSQKKVAAAKRKSV